MAGVAVAWIHHRTFPPTLLTPNGPVLLNKEAAATGQELQNILVNVRDAVEQQRTLKGRPVSVSFSNLQEDLEPDPKVV